MKIDPESQKQLVGEIEKRQRNTVGRTLSKIAEVRTNIPVDRSNSSRLSTGTVSPTM
jgi:hypothetical protein